MRFARQARLVSQSCAFVSLAAVAGGLGACGIVPGMAAFIAALGCACVAHLLVAGERGLPSLRAALGWTLFGRTPAAPRRSSLVDAVGLPPDADI